MEKIYASVDLGATNIKCTFADEVGNIAGSRSVPTLGYEEPPGVLDRIARLVVEMTGEIGRKPSGLGMGVPGLVDLKSGVTKFLPNLPTQWREVPVAEKLSPKVDCPVYLLNDVRMATLGELVYGHGRAVSNMVFFALGTGIGGGVVVDGKLRLGPLGAAGELGHINILPEGPLCGCGSRGCMETLASGPALAGEGVRLLRAGLAPKLYEITGGDPGQVTAESMGQAAREGDENVRKAIIRAASYLGLGASMMVTALHPELIVIGGGVANIGPLLFDTVKETIVDRVRMLPADQIPVKPSLLGDRAGTMGGVALAAKQGMIGG